VTRFGKYFLTGLLLIGLSSGFAIVMANQQYFVVADPSPAADFSPPPLPSPTPPAERPKPTPTPTPTVTKYSAEEIYHMIDSYSGQSGVNPNVIRHIAICESGFNPLAINGQYAGLFQFDALTWKNTRLLQHLDPNPSLRLDAVQAIQTAVYLVSTHRGTLWPNCYPK